MPGSRPTNGRASEARARSSTLVITNVTKLVGLGIAVNEMILRTDARNSVIAFCAVCVLGVQVAENVALKFIERMFDPRGTEGD